MNHNEYQIVGLYDHNADSYNKIKEAFNKGEQVVGIVHATGTGKSYNALQLAYDNKDKKIAYVTPTVGIIEHINKIIEDNPNLDLKRDFPNLEFSTYQSLLTPYKTGAMEEIDCDILVLDEFHHTGAPIWGKAVNKLIETHKEAKILGMSAYTVRDRGTEYERDMANPEKDELFSNKIVSRYNLCDAILEGVLPKPNYKSIYTILYLNSILEVAEKKINNLPKDSEDYKRYNDLLKDVKRQMHKASGINDLLKKNMKPDGKYIYFCPPCSQEGTNDIETIKKEAIEWFKEIANEEDIVIYTSTSDMPDHGKANRDAFYDDKTLDGKSADGKLRVMFAINQYNEGVHAPNIDGVIMGRGTSSDIVYFEQLGRALAVRGETKEKFDEYMTLTKEELLRICKEKDILIEENDEKEDLAEKLVAPVVIDLANNVDFIRELQDDIKDRVKEAQAKGPGYPRNIVLKSVDFGIEVENINLYEVLRYVIDRSTKTWEDYYELAKAYYEHHGDLIVDQFFKTINGYDYDEKGYALGNWIKHLRGIYKAMQEGTIDKPLTKEQIDLLEQIGMIWDVNSYRWMQHYNLAKAYYEHYGDLIVGQDFKTINGYDYDEKGYALGNWIMVLRYIYKAMQEGTIDKLKDKPLTPEQIELLEQIGMIWNAKLVNKSKLSKSSLRDINNVFVNTLDKYDGNSLPDIELLTSDFEENLENSIKKSK